MLSPGTLLNLKKAPDTGLWTVISCNTNHERPWRMMDIILLNRSMLLTLTAVSKQLFKEQWDVVHEP
jgi:negative regulator of replication initiation